MTKEAIYNAINPSWWQTSISNLFGTQFVATQILFSTKALSNCVYTSSAPYQTNGLNAGTAPYNRDTTDLIEQLREAAAQRLYDMHATAITGTQQLTYQFGAQE